jgi:hypothetical protein
LVASLGLVVSGRLVSPAGAHPHDGAAEFRKEVTVRGIVQHLDKLQRIADRNNGTRASGTPGFKKSVDYVVERLRDAGYRPTVQAFQFPFFQQLASPRAPTTSSPTSRAPVTSRRRCSRPTTS